MTDLLEIAAKVEAATEPDRELDVLIWAHKLGYKPEWQGTNLVVGIEGVVGWIDPGEHRRNFNTNRNTIGPASIPPYTASLDAAMTLVPEGWLCERVGENAWPDVEGRPGIAEIRRRVFGQPSRILVMDCATPALALCAAALRARDAIADRNPEGGDAVAAPCVA